MTCKIDLINYATKGLIREENFSGSSSIIGWAYQDFIAGNINSTSVTLSSQPYGTFDAPKVINNSAYITKSTGNDGFVYSIASKAFGSIIKSTGNTAQFITLNAVPNNFWGNVRIWFRYVFDNGLPSNYQEAPAFIRDSILGTVKDLITPFEIGAISKIPNIISKTYSESPYTVQSTDDIILVNTTAGNVTLTLPITGRFRIKWVAGTNMLTINVAGEGTIDGLNSYVFGYINDCIEVVTNSTGVYYII